jgi:hypothetical protein
VCCELLLLLVFSMSTKCSSSTQHRWRTWPPPVVYSACCYEWARQHASHHVVPVVAREHAVKVGKGCTELVPLTPRQLMLLLELLPPRVCVNNCKPQARVRLLLV